jgi:glyoxylase-like metal-dependent hydrolase (beta-lactamase superfamily II)
MSKFTIEMLPARQGDALWIEYGDSAHPRRALIDAGTPETWDVVRPKIEQLAPAERRFELLVVSHIDLDHIGGVLPLLAAAKDLETSSTTCGSTASGISRRASSSRWAPWRARSSPTCS